MNKQLLILALAVVFNVSSAFASTNPTINAVKAKTILVNATDWKSETISVELRDENGEVLVNDILPTTTRRNYNLKNLPAGNYTVIIENEVRTSTQSFTLSNDAIIKVEEASIDYKPVINLVGEDVDVNFYSPTSKTVRIFSGYNELFAETYKNTPSLNKRFDLSNLDKGTYTVAISSNGKYYTKTITK